jgi:hypothetical protein
MLRITRSRIASIGAAHGTVMCLNLPPMSRAFRRAASGHILPGPDASKRMLQLPKTLPEGKPAQAATEKPDNEPSARRAPNFSHSSHTHFDLRLLRTIRRLITIETEVH